MTFQNDFFSKNIPSWEQHLAHMKGKPVHALELGSLEGRSACWLLENILTHPDSTLQCVDVLKCAALEQNLKPFGGKARFYHQDSVSAMSNFVHGQFDLAYIDANHTARDVIVEAGLVYPLMKSGGIMIFDDYGHHDWTVKPAVDFFIQHWPNLKVLRKKWQAIIQLDPC